MKEAREYIRKLNIVSTKDKEKEETIEEKENVQEKVRPYLVCIYWIIGENDKNTNVEFYNI